MSSHSFSRFNSSAAVNLILCRLWNDWIKLELRLTPWIRWKIFFSWDDVSTITQSYCWHVVADKGSNKVHFIVSTSLQTNTYAASAPAYRPVAPPQAPPTGYTTGYRYAPYWLRDNTPWHIHAPRTIPPKKHHRLARLKEVEKVHFLPERTLDSLCMDTSSLTFNSFWQFYGK